MPESKGVAIPQCQPPKGDMIVSLMHKMEHPNIYIKALRDYYKMEGLIYEFCFRRLHVVIMKTISYNGIQNAP